MKKCIYLLCLLLCFLSLGCEITLQETLSPEASAPSMKEKALRVESDKSEYLTRHTKRYFRIKLKGKQAEERQKIVLVADFYDNQNEMFSPAPVDTLIQASEYFIDNDVAEVAIQRIDRNRLFIIREDQKNEERGKIDGEIKTTFKTYDFIIYVSQESKRDAATTSWVGALTFRLYNISAQKEVFAVHEKVTETFADKEDLATREDALRKAAQKCLSKLKIYLKK